MKKKKTRPRKNPFSGTSLSTNVFGRPVILDRDGNLLHTYPLPPKPKPETVEEAYTAMVEAGEAPLSLRTAPRKIRNTNRANVQLDFVTSPKDRQILVDRVISQREANRKYCPHLRPDGKPNIKWHEQSNHIVTGVCGICFSPFDTRNPEDEKLFLADPKADINMGRAGQHAQLHDRPFLPEFEVRPPNFLQKIWLWVEKRIQ